MNLLVNEVSGFSENSLAANEFFIETELPPPATAPLVDPSFFFRLLPEFPSNFALPPVRELAEFPAMLRALLDFSRKRPSRQSSVQFN